MPDYSVYKGEDGEWKAKNDDKSRAASSHATQADATAAARGYVEHQGGGEVSIHGTDGQVRDKRTIPPAKDPYPPAG